MGRGAASGGAEILYGPSTSRRGGSSSTIAEVQLAIELGDPARAYRALIDGCGDLNKSELPDLVEGLSEAQIEAAYQGLLSQGVSFDEHAYQAERSYLANYWPAFLEEGLKEGKPLDGDPRLALYYRDHSGFYVSEQSDGPLTATLVPPSDDVGGVDRYLEQLPESHKAIYADEEVVNKSLGRTVLAALADAVLKDGTAERFEAVQRKLGARRPVELFSRAIADLTRIALIRDLLPALPSSVEEYRRRAAHGNAFEYLHDELWEVTEHLKLGRAAEDGVYEHLTRLCLLPLTQDQFEDMLTWQVRSIRRRAKEGATS